MIEAAQQTLEKMFFAVPDSVSADRRRPPGELIAAGLLFHGSPGGRFGIVASEPLARVLAANFLGVDEVSDTHVVDVVSELTNMICGAALTKLESDAAFALDAPRTIRIPADQPAPEFVADTPSFARLEFPEGTLALFLSFDKTT